MGKTTKYTERKFLGVLPENPTKEQMRFHQKHERAYLKGHDTFRFGYEKETNSEGKVVTVRDHNGSPIPILHDVKQELIIDKEKRKLLTGK